MHPQSLALRTVDSMFDRTVAALRGGGPAIAESAMAGNLKLLEGVVKSDPSNVRYLELACMGYASYALAFAEDEPPRALLFYSRAEAYGVRGMVQQGIPRGAFDADAPTMRSALAGGWGEVMCRWCSGRQTRGEAPSACNPTTPMSSPRCPRRTRSCSG